MDKCQPCHRRGNGACTISKENLGTSIIRKGIWLLRRLYGNQQKTTLGGLEALGSHGSNARRVVNWKCVWKILVVVHIAF